MRRKSYNRYKEGLLVQDFDGFFLVPKRNKFDVSVRPDDRFHTVVQDDRLDLLAYKYFGDARLWWVIAEYNNVMWFFDINIGDTLRLPSITVLNMDILV